MSLSNTKIITSKIGAHGFEVNALTFLAPDGAYRGDFKAVFTHGYTSSKSSILSWATRLADFGISTIIFDLPGHYLGSFNEVESFEKFKSHAHRLFENAFEKLLAEEKALGRKFDGHLLMGGHSLGALLSLYAAEEDYFKKIEKTLFLVGFGINQEISTHFFDTDFYQKTLNIRRQLVSPALDSGVVFPWIREEKDHLKANGQKIVLISGEDDVVVSKDGADYLAELLEKNNDVQLIKPKRLSHHQPELASTHIFTYLKKEFQF